MGWKGDEKSLLQLLFRGKVIRRDGLIDHHQNVVDELPLQLLFGLLGDLVNRKLCQQLLDANLLLGDLRLEFIGNAAPLDEQRSAELSPRSSRASSRSALATDASGPASPSR
jgi:hypothetical protein